MSDSPIRLLAHPTLRKAASEICTELTQRGLPCQVIDPVGTDIAEAAAVGAMRVELLEARCDLLLFALSGAAQVAVPGLEMAAVLARTGTRKTGVACENAQVLEYRADDLRAGKRPSQLALTLRYLDDLPSRLEVSAERELARYLGAGPQDLRVEASLTWRSAAASSAVAWLSLSATLGQAEASAETMVLMGPDPAEREFALTMAEELATAVGEELAAR